MKTGDANATFWLKGGGDRSYCVEVSSRFNSRKDEHRYAVSVELWTTDQFEDSRVVLVRENIATFTEAMRIGRRVADRQETKERKRGRG